MQEVLTTEQKMGKKLEEKIQNAMLSYHDDLIEMSETLMQKPKQKKSKKVLQSGK